MKNSQFKLPRVENVFLFSALLFKKYGYKWPETRIRQVSLTKILKHYRYGSTGLIKYDLYYFQNQLH